jgi:phage terminase small subunit
MKFVAAVAGGRTQTAAYKEAGYATDGKPRTTVRNARQLAQNAEVRAAIEKMQLVREIRAHAMGVIVRLSLEAEDDKVRLAAAQWLHEETGKQIAEREKLARSEERSRESGPEIIAKLRMLYAKALPDREPPLLETVPEARGEE